VTGFHIVKDHPFANLILYSCIPGRSPRRFSRLGIGEIKLRYDVVAWQPKKSYGTRNCATSTITMRSIARGIQPVCAPLLRSKHTSRIGLSNAIPAPAWARPFHASANLRVVDLAYSFHDNKGSAKGDPIVIIHGLFGSKKNNRSVSKYVTKSS
jgi:hypothetical protein